MLAREVWLHHATFGSTLAISLPLHKVSRISLAIRRASLSEKVEEL